MSSLLKLAGVLLLAAFVSADPTRQCPDSSPAQCPIDPCATVRCSAGHVCQANYCNNFPTVGAAACTASCVSSTATCPLLPGLTVGFPLRCGSGSTAFPTCTDGCNSCACQNGEFGACTERFCTTLATCTDAAGRTYESGSTIPRRLTSGADASDNSNLCVCSGYGRWVCSQLPRATVAPTPPSTTQHGSCPDGSAPSQCLLDPCATWKCTATTQCVANYCDGFPTPGRGPCTASCVPLPTLTPPTVPPTGACPDGSNPVACTLNPCAVTTCLAGSECVPNYCNTGAGPCTATCVPRRTFPPLTQKPTTTRRPTTTGSGSCPDGSNPVQCTVNPCAAVLCQTGSTCVPNYCSNFPAPGDVPCTAQCVAQPSPPVNTCPDGSAIAMCFQNPCANILCPATKQCVANYCNGFPTPGRAPCTATCVARP